MNEAPAPLPTSATEKPSPAKQPAKKASGKKASGKKAAAKKSAAKKAPSRSAAKPAKPAATPAAEPTDEQVRIRAYFIAERRSRMALAGDSNNDWIQAREELMAELRQHQPGGNGSH